MERSEADYKALADQKLWPMNVQTTGDDDYNSIFHDQTLWEGALLDCSKGLTNPMHWIDEKGMLQTVSYNKVESSGHQLSYYKFRSDSHEKAWDELGKSQSPYMRYITASGSCYTCVFRCTLFNDKLFRELDYLY